MLSFSHSFFMICKSHIQCGKFEVAIILNSMIDMIILNSMINDHHQHHDHHLTSQEVSLPVRQVWCWRRKELVPQAGSCWLIMVFMKLCWWFFGDHHVCKQAELMIFYWFCSSQPSTFHWVAISFLAVVCLFVVSKWWHRHIALLILGQFGTGKFGTKS